MGEKLTTKKPQVWAGPLPFDIFPSAKESKKFRELNKKVRQSASKGEENICSFICNSIGKCSTYLNQEGTHSLYNLISIFGRYHKCF